MYHVHRFKRRIYDKKYTRLVKLIYLKIILPSFYDLEIALIVEINYSNVYNFHCHIQRGIYILARKESRRFMFLVFTSSSPFQLLNYHSLLVYIYVISWWKFIIKKNLLQNYVINYIKLYCVVFKYILRNIHICLYNTYA